MSSASIQDEGYTPPDFIEKLFKRTSTSSSENIFRPLTSISNIPTLNYYSSTPIINISQNKFSPNKINRTHSLNQQERISTKKFKIFYNTVIEGFYPEIQSSDIWQNFQKSLNNPFEYDKFIQELRLLKQQKKQQKNEQKLRLSDLILPKLQEKSKSSERYKSKIPTNEKSANKYTRNQQAEEEKMKKNIKYIRNILKHGTKFIKTG